MGVLRLQDGTTLLLQDGSSFLLQDGADVLPDPCALLLEDGSGGILLEDGTPLTLEGCPPVPPLTPGGTRTTPGPETRAYWEDERTRLRVLRDDDEILMLV